MPKTKLNVTTSNTTSKPFSNPNLIYGSSFGEFFQALYRQNQFELMYQFTAQRSKKQLGKIALLNFYQKNFKFDFQLGKLTSSYIIGDTYTLTYANSKVFATKRKLMINCTLENDTVKLILDSTSINKHSFFFSE